MTNVKTESSRIALLAFLKQVENHIKNSVDIMGEWKIERPSVQQAFRNPLPPTWIGTNHVRVTLTLDLLKSQFTIKGDEEVKG